MLENLGFQVSLCSCVLESVFVLRVSFFLWGMFIVCDTYFDFLLTRNILHFIFTLNNFMISAFVYYRKHLKYIPVAFSACKVHLCLFHKYLQGKNKPKQCQFHFYGLERSTINVFHKKVFIMKGSVLCTASFYRFKVEPGSVFSADKLEK